MVEGKMPDPVELYHGKKNANLVLLESLIGTQQY